MRVVAAIASIAIVLSVMLISGCGGVKLQTTNYYYIMGNSNTVNQAVTSTSTPDIDATTTSTASIPASVIP